MVHDFTLSVLDGGVREDPTRKPKLDKIREMFLAYKMPDNEEIETMASLLEVRLLICFETSDPLQTFGHESWDSMRVSNSPVVDGAGHSAPHFRFIWESEPMSEVQQALAGAAGAQSLSGLPG